MHTQSPFLCVAHIFKKNPVIYTQAFLPSSGKSIVYENWKHIWISCRHFKPHCMVYIYAILVCQYICGLTLYDCPIGMHWKNCCGWGNCSTFTAGRQKCCHYHIYWDWHSVCWRLGFRAPLGSNPALSRGRQLVSFRFEYRLPVPEHRN